MNQYSEKQTSLNSLKGYFAFNWTAINNQNNGRISIVLFGKTVYREDLIALHKVHISLRLTL